MYKFSPIAKADTVKYINFESNYIKFRAHMIIQVFQKF